MIADHDLALRKTLIAAMKGFAPISAIVGTRIYEEPEDKPVWPFIRYGVTQVEPIRLDGWDMQDHSLTIHGFAKGPGQNAVSALKTVIQECLHEQEFTLSSSAGLVLIQKAGHQILRDTSESGAYHAVVEFQAITGEFIEEPEIVSEEFAVLPAAASDELLPANTSRAGIIIYNTSGWNAYLREGDEDDAGTALGDWNYKIAPNEVWNAPLPMFKGPIQVIFDGIGGDGGLNVTERIGQ